MPANSTDAINNFFIGNNLWMVFIIHFHHLVDNLAFLESAVADRRQDAVPVPEAPWIDVFVHVAGEEQRPGVLPPGASEGGRAGSACPGQAAVVKHKAPGLPLGGVGGGVKVSPVCFLVVKDGKIVEQGNHRELLKKKGYYHELYTRQYEDEATARILA